MTFLGVRKNQLNKLFEDYNDALGMDGDAEVRTRVKEIDHRHKDPVPQPSKNKGGAGGGKEQTKICEFCGESDIHFLDASKYEMHLWKECPVLVTCQHCAQVVEVENLNNHLLDECEYNNNFIEVRNPPQNS